MIFSQKQRQQRDRMLPFFTSNSAIISNLGDNANTIMVFSQEQRRQWDHMPLSSPPTPRRFRISSKAFDGYNWIALGKILGELYCGINTLIHFLFFVMGYCINDKKVG